MKVAAAASLLQIAKCENRIRGATDLTVVRVKLGSLSRLLFPALGPEGTVCPADELA